MQTDIVTPQTRQPVVNQSVENKMEEKNISNINNTNNENKSKLELLVQKKNFQIYLVN